MSLNPSNCEDINPLLDAYHDGELDEIERDTVASHLASCPSCQAKIAQIKTVVNSLQSLPRLQMSRDLSADVDFIKRALESTKVASSVSAADADSSEKTGAQIKQFPAKSQSSGQAAVKKFLPLPGPVIFASVAAAAALALVIAVPRYLNNTAYSPTVASLPKQGLAKFDDNQRSEPAIVAQKNSQSEIKLAHSAAGGQGSAEEANRELARNASRPEANKAGESKDAQIPADANAPEIASAQVPSVSEPNLPADKSVADSTDTRDTQSASQGDQTTDEHDVQASATSSPEQGELLALYPSDQNTVTDELAIPTDEDGLYALKL